MKLMAGVEPLDRSDLENLEPLFQAVEQVMGFVPNSRRFKSFPRYHLHLAENKEVADDKADNLFRLSSLPSHVYPTTHAVFAEEKA